MNYSVRKRAPDDRKNTCGFSTPDYHVNVIELTLYNASSFINLLYYGYIVEETDMGVGIWTEEEYDLFGGEPLDYVKLGLINRPREDHMRKVGPSFITS